MTVSCDVIQDLLPLYVEDMLSVDSQKLVEQHLPTCETCRQLLSEMKGNLSFPIENNPNPIKKVQSQFRKKKIQAVVFATLLSIILVITAIGVITAPSFHSFSEDLVTITQEDNGNVVASFNEKVTGYEVELSQGETGGDNFYFIRTWNSIWGKFLSQQPSDVVLNTAGEDVDAVYFDEARGTESILIFGQGYSGGIQILSELFYAYYAIIALGALIISIVIAILAKKHPRLREVATKIALLPTAYIVGHLFVLGVDGSSYAGTRPLYMIVLLTVPLYILFLFIYLYVIKKKEN